LKADGSIVGWGADWYGQISDIPTGNDFTAISAGLLHSLALKSDGSIVGWGLDEAGRATPPQGNDFIAIAARQSHSLALKSDGSIVGWGWDASGQVSGVPAGKEFTAIAAGGFHGLALKFSSNPTPVPEPSTLFLLAGGLAGLSGMAWRRRGQR
jgi:alpha-tubulin suppressor-like RCC1 family protein